MKTYIATIIPTIAGGNIEVRISANNMLQTVELIKTLPYFKSFVKHPVLEEENNLTKLSGLIKKANAKTQANLATID